MNVTMPVRAVLWDLDGVIVNSGRYHYEAYREVLGPLGRDLAEEEYLGRLFGLRNQDILRRLLGDLPDDEIARLAALKEEAFRRRVQGHVQALPGAAELLTRLHEADKRQAIVSSTPRANVELILGSLGLRAALDTIVAEEDVSRGKPDPEGFLLAASRLAVRPEDCIVVEDAPEGVEAAKAAGMRCLAVATTREAPRLARADLVVETLEDGRARRFLLGA